MGDADETKFTFYQ